jgi:hypothetical protein
MEGWNEKRFRVHQPREENDYICWRGVCACVKSLKHAFDSDDAAFQLILISTTLSTCLSIHVSGSCVVHLARWVVAYSLPMTRRLERGSFMYCVFVDVDEVDQ